MSKGYNFTCTAEFELDGGRRLQIPEPDPDHWDRQVDHPCKEWPAAHVRKIYPPEGTDQAYDCVLHGNGLFTVSHEAGRCWLHDFAPLLVESEARVVSWTSWRRHDAPVMPIDSDLSYQMGKPRRETY